MTLSINAKIGLHLFEYIKATFRFKEKDVSDAFYRFIEDKNISLDIALSVSPV